MAAVFLMHGIPSMAAAERSTPRSGIELSSTQEGGEAASTSALSVVGLGVSAGEEQADHGGPSRAIASHVWNGCLAVLLTGMALLAVAAVRRLPALPRHRATLRPRGPTAWASPPRPPDLFALCLLRT